MKNILDKINIILDKKWSVAIIDRILKIFFAFFGYSGVLFLLFAGLTFLRIATDRPPPGSDASVYVFIGGFYLAIAGIILETVGLFSKSAWLGLMMIMAGGSYNLFYIVLRLIKSIESSHYRLDFEELLYLLPGTFSIIAGIILRKKAHSAKAGKLGSKRTGALGKTI